MQTHSLGLVLSGGGGKGAYQIGAWRALMELGWDARITGVSGASVGALNAALIGCTDYAQAETLWKSITPLQFLDIDLPFANGGIFSRDGLIELIRGSKALLAECDRQGMLVMDEYIDHWYIHKTEHDYVDYFNDWWHQDLTDMVEKDYNHPCVVLYSTGNEVSETAQKRGIALTKEMTDFLHGLDDSRPVTCGVSVR